MSLSAIAASVVGVSAFVGAGLLGSDDFGWGRASGRLAGRPSGRGSRFGTRRPSLPPPGRRVPPHVGGAAVASRHGSTGDSDGRHRGAGKGFRGDRAWGRGRGRGRSGARWATSRDLRPLDVTRNGTGATPPGRIVLGQRSRRLVAAERAQSVIVFGPTQSHKTSGFAVPALLEWRGPVVAASVKTDLIDHTIEHRRRQGEVQCFDPSGSTGLVSASWSPLASSRTWPGARRSSAALTELAKSTVGTMSDGDFWYATAAKMLAPLLFAAAYGHRDMGDVIRWVDTHEESEILDLLSSAGVPEALHAAQSAFGKEDRQRSSIYTTVETILEPFADIAFSPGQDQFIDPLAYPSDAASSGPGLSSSFGPSPGPSLSSVDPARLVGGENTLYLCAPAHDQRRLTPLFVSVVRQIVEHVYDLVSLTHRPLDPPLLLVLDEAANIAPLADLDALAATAAGHGVQLVTVWHDLAQITARFGPRATTVVNNHRAKLFLSGISDPSTLDYASHLIGDEELLLPATTQGGTEWEQYHPLTDDPEAGATRLPAADRSGGGGAGLRRPSAGAATASALVLGSRAAQAGRGARWPD